MSVLGVISCEILELELACLIAGDKEIESITVLGNEHSKRLLETLNLLGTPDVKTINTIRDFSSSSRGVDVLVHILELGLHNRKEDLQQGLTRAVEEMAPHVDAILLGYGLCGNALENIETLFEGIEIPIIQPMDTDHPVDDCVGLLIGGRERYYGEQCKVAGTFYMIPGWAFHWKRMFESEFGKMSLTMAKRLFVHYERSLIIDLPVMTRSEMEEHVTEFNDLFGLRTESCKGSMEILTTTWEHALACLPSNNGELKVDQSN